MKYYIPTTTLNYNNILSTESISPACFYDQRGFGYCRWILVAENPYRDRILLYTSPVLVSRTNKDLEDHSLLVEIEIDRLFPEQQDGIHYVQETIYLDPTKARFIFDSEENRDKTLSMSQSSLETKLVHLYRNDVERVNPSESETRDLQRIEEKPVTVFSDEIDKDRRINKLKGLLYGFYIGAMLSTRMGYVHLKKILRELSNLVAVAISQEELGAKEEGRIIELLDEYRLLVYKIEFEKIQNYSEKKVLDARVDGMCSIIPQFKIDVANFGKTANEWLKKQRQCLTYKVNADTTVLNIDKEAIIANAEGLTKLSVGNGLPDFVRSWFNDVLLQARYDSKISTYKDELLKSLLQKSKEIMESAGGWDDTPERRHLNAMRRMASGEMQPEFDWSISYTASLLAVVERGDEWQEIIEYLEDYWHNDYRLAFAYYGVLYGFASLPRDFTDILYLYKDKAYLSQLYAEIHRQLHQKEIVCNFANVPTMNIDEPRDWCADTYSSITSFAVAGGSTNDSFKAKIKAEVELVWNNVLKSVPDQARKKERFYKALNNFYGDDLISFMAELNDYSGWEKTNMPWKNLLDCLGIKKAYEQKYGSLNQSDKVDSDEKSSVGSSQSLDDLFTHGVECKEANDSITMELGSMLTDNSWWNETAGLVADNDSRKQYLKDVEWFVENHEDKYRDMKKGLIDGHYKGQDQSNSQVLDRFVRFLKNKRKSLESWLQEIYKKVPIERIENLLREKYGK